MFNSIEKAAGECNPAAFLCKIIKCFLYVLIFRFYNNNWGECLFISSIIDNIAVRIGPEISTIVSYELEGKDLSTLNTQKKNSEIYLKIDKALLVLKDKGKELINNVYIVDDNDNGKWRYIIDKSKDHTGALGDEFSDVSKLDKIKKAVEVNIMHYFKIIFN